MNVSNYYKALGLDPFEVAIPLTFHIKNSRDSEFAKFEKYYQENTKIKNSQNVWIIKPGENSNRGVGIQVANSLKEIKSLIDSFGK